MRPVLWNTTNKVKITKKHDANKYSGKEFSYDWHSDSGDLILNLLKHFQSIPLVFLTQQLGFAVLFFFGKVHSTTHAAPESTTYSCPSIFGTNYITEGTLCLTFVRAHFTTSAALFAYKSCAILACGYVFNKGCLFGTRTDKVLHKKCVTIVQTTPFGRTALLQYEHFMNVWKEGAYCATI